jgi:hypothetical protein
MRKRLRYAPGARPVVRLNRRRKKAEHEDRHEQGEEGHPLAEQDAMPRTIDRRRPAKDGEPAAQHRDGGEHRGGDDHQPGMQLLVETARHDEIVGHERERARQPDARQAEEHEEGGERGRIAEAALRRLERERAGTALERPGHQRDARQRQAARDPEHHDQDRMGRRKEREGAAGAAEDAGRRRHVEKPLGRDEQVCQHDQRHERQEHGRDAVDVDERAATETVAEFAGHAVARVP